MSTGTLRRHREVLQKLRETEADQEIAEAVVTAEPTPEPEVDETPEETAPAPRKRKTQTEE